MLQARPRSAGMERTDGYRSSQGNAPKSWMRSGGNERLPAATNRNTSDNTPTPKSQRNGNC